MIGRASAFGNLQLCAEQSLRLGRAPVDVKATINEPGRRLKSGAKVNRRSAHFLFGWVGIGGLSEQGSVLQCAGRKADFFHPFPSRFQMKYISSWKLSPDLIDAAIKTFLETGGAPPEGVNMAGALARHERSRICDL